MEEQVALETSGSKIWVKSVSRSTVGKDARQMVADVRVFTSGRACRTTWAKGGTKAEQCFRAHTMGYEAPRGREVREKEESTSSDIEML